MHDLRRIGAGPECSLDECVREVRVVRVGNGTQGLLSSHIHPALDRRPAHAGRQGRRVVSAFVATAFAQEDAEAAIAQWCLVADQLRPRAPKLAAIMDEAEHDVLAYTTFPAAHRAKLHSTDEMDKRLLRWRGRIPGARTTSWRSAATRLEAPPGCLIRALPA